jgi:TRAP-type mannitol/chloroaromatic compound transport system permease large subunit
MLCLIVVAIMMGFPTAFTLMGLGMIFGFIAFWNPGQHWYDNRAFDLIVQRTYGVMTNDTLLSIPALRLHGLHHGARRAGGLACSTACSSPSGACRPRWR